MLQLSKIFNIRVDRLFNGNGEIQIENSKVPVALSAAFALIACVVAFGLNRFGNIEILIMSILFAGAGYAIGVAVDAITEKIKNK